MRLYHAWGPTRREHTLAPNNRNGGSMGVYSIRLSLTIWPEAGHRPDGVVSDDQRQGGADQAGHYWAGVV
jgi:hypothetical protein